MTEYLLLSFVNDEGDRQNIRFNDFDEDLTEEELKETMKEILNSGVLKGKHGPLTDIVTGKIVNIKEDVIVQG